MPRWTWTRNTLPPEGAIQKLWCDRCGTSVWADARVVPAEARGWWIGAAGMQELVLCGRCALRLEGLPSEPPRTFVAPPATVPSAAAARSRKQGAGHKAGRGETG